MPTEFDHLPEPDYPLDREDKPISHQRDHRYSDGSIDSTSPESNNLEDVRKWVLQELSYLTGTNKEANKLAEHIGVSDWEGVLTLLQDYGSKLVTEGTGNLRDNEYSIHLYHQLCSEMAWAAQQMGEVEITQKIYDQHDKVLDEYFPAEKQAHPDRLVATAYTPYLNHDRYLEQIGSKG